MFKKVVWATDGSDAADQALAVAERLVSESGGELIALHCVEMTLKGKAGGRYSVYADEDELKEKIAGQMQELSARGVPTRIEVTRADVGQAAESIAAVAREQSAEVIVVGTRGRGPLAGLLLGSVTQRLLHTASCPVLAVPTQARNQG